MPTGLLLAVALASAAAPPPAPPDTDRASRELLLYLAEFGGGDDAVDPTELEPADLPDPSAVPKPAEKPHTDRTTTPDHAAPPADPPSR